MNISLFSIIGSPVHDYLRSSILFSTLVQVYILPMGFCQKAKISQFGLNCMVKHYVVMLQVKMHEAFLMHFFNPLQDSLKPECGHIFTNSFLSTVHFHQKVQQSPILSEFHSYVRLILIKLTEGTYHYFLSSCVFTKPLKSHVVHAFSLRIQLQESLVFLPHIILDRKHFSRCSGLVHINVSLDFLIPCSDLFCLLWEF